MSATPSAPGTKPSASDVSALAVLLFAIPMFIVLLTIGWHRLLESSVLHGYAPLAWVGGLFFAGWGVALARAVAADRVKAKRLKLNGQKISDPTWLAYLVLLLFVSAFGTLSAILYYGEGGNIIQESIDIADRCVDKLSELGKSVVVTHVYDEKVARVERLKASLIGEITNERNCGDGPKSIEILEKLGKELPGLQRLTGRTTDCADAQNLAARYGGMIDDQLRQSDEYRSDRVAERRDFSQQLEAAIARQRESLGAARQALSSSAFGIDQARRRIEEVVKDIDTQTARTKSLSSAPVQWHCEVDVEGLRHVGSFWHTVSILSSRSDRLATYLYIAAAFAVDALLIVFFMRVIGSVAERDERPPPGRTGSRPGQPTPLWVNR